VGISAPSKGSFKKARWHVAHECGHQIPEEGTHEKCHITAHRAPLELHDRIVAGEPDV
jgi:hypothetical protein